MAETDGDKTQDPTPHRRQKAREEGQIVKSQDLASAVILLAGMLGLLMSGGSLVEFIGRYAHQQLGGEAWLRIDRDFTVFHWNGTLMELARHLLPILGLLLITAIVIDMAQVGFLFLPEKLAFDITRLDPLKGLGRIFSMANAVRLVLGLCKIGVIAAVAFLRPVQPCEYDSGPDRPVPLGECPVSG
jgi:flagellar biosynthesis protein FlhB